MEIRGKTRDNPIAPEYLRSIGVTEESWGKLMDSGTIIGAVFECNGQVVGYCYADTETREILVLAVLAEFDGQGIGKKLLTDMLARLHQLSDQKVWLAATPEPNYRAYGFYRHMGWKPTGNFDDNGDEILEYVF